MSVSDLNEKPVAMSLKAPAGRGALLKLAGADVFVQDFHPGGIERVGLGENELRKVLPACRHRPGGRHLPRTK